MSYEIEYRYAVFAYDAQQAHSAMNALVKDTSARPSRFPDYAAERCVVTFVEEGASNTFEADTNRRSRSWQLQHCGAVSECLERVITMSTYVERGLTKPFGREQRAETYIAAYRNRMAASALPLENFFSMNRGGVLDVKLHLFDAEKASVHPWWRFAVAQGWTYKPQYSGGGIRLPLENQLQLECLLQTIPAIATGLCATFGSLDKYSGICSSLNRLSGGQQLSLIA